MNSDGSCYASAPARGVLLGEYLYTRRYRGCLPRSCSESPCSVSHTRIDCVAFPTKRSRRVELEQGRRVRRGAKNAEARAVHSWTMNADHWDRDVVASTALDEIETPFGTETSLPRMHNNAKERVLTDARSVSLSDLSSILADGLRRENVTCNEPHNERSHGHIRTDEKRPRRVSAEHVVIGYSALFIEEEDAARADKYVDLVQKQSAVPLNDSAGEERFFQFVLGLLRILALDQVHQAKYLCVGGMGIHQDEIEFLGHLGIPCIPAEEPRVFAEYATQCEKDGHAVLLVSHHPSALGLVSEMVQVLKPGGDLERNVSAVSGKEVASWTNSRPDMYDLNRFESDFPDLKPCQAASYRALVSIQGIKHAKAVKTLSKFRNIEHMWEARDSSSLSVHIRRAIESEIRAQDLARLEREYDPYAYLDQDTDEQETGQDEDRMGSGSGVPATTSPDDYFSQCLREHVNVEAVREAIESRPALALFLVSSEPSSRGYLKWLLLSVGVHADWGSPRSEGLGEDAPVSTLSGISDCEANLKTSVSSSGSLPLAAFLSVSTLTTVEPPSKDPEPEHMNLSGPAVYVIDGIPILIRYLNRDLGLCAPGLGIETGPLVGLLSYMRKLIRTHVGSSHRGIVLVLGSRPRGSVGVGSKKNRALQDCIPWVKRVMQALGVLVLDGDDASVKSHSVPSSRRTYSRRSRRHRQWVSSLDLAAGVAHMCKDRQVPCKIFANDQGFLASQQLLSLGNVELLLVRKAFEILRPNDPMQTSDLLHLHAKVCSSSADSIAYRVDLQTFRALHRPGLQPASIPDVLALAGLPSLVSSQRVKGVKGIGVKTAEALVSLYGSLEQVISEVSRCLSAKETAKQTSRLLTTSTLKKFATFKRENDDSFLGLICDRGQLEMRQSLTRLPEQVRPMMEGFLDHMRDASENAKDDVYDSADRKTLSSLLQALGFKLNQMPKIIQDITGKEEKKEGENAFEHGMTTATGRESSGKALENQRKAGKISGSQSDAPFLFAMKNADSSCSSTVTRLSDPARVAQVLASAAQHHTMGISLVRLDNDHGSEKQMLVISTESDENQLTGIRTERGHPLWQDSENLALVPCSPGQISPGMEYFVSFLADAASASRRQARRSPDSDVVIVSWNPKSVFRALARAVSDPPTLLSHLQAIHLWDISVIYSFVCETVVSSTTERDIMRHAYPSVEQSKALRPRRSENALSTRLEDAVWSASSAFGVLEQVREAYDVPELLSSNALLAIEAPLTSVLARMEWNGLPMSMKALQALQQRLQRARQRHAERMFKVAGHTFDPSSAKQTADVLYGELGARSVREELTDISFSPAPKPKASAKLTATAQQSRPSIRDDVLQCIASGLDAFADMSRITPPTQSYGGQGQSDNQRFASRTNQPRRAMVFAKVLMLYRSASFTERHVLAPLLSAVHADTGCVHSTFKQLGTVTGRISSVEPNLQGMPSSRSLWGALLRSAVQAPKGHKILCADLEQIELTIMASLSEDEELCAAIQKQHDFHALVARKLFDVPDGAPVFDELRQRAKRLTFAVLYGQGVHGLGHVLHKNVSECLELMEKHRQVLPALYRLREDLIEEARHNLFAETLLGRRMPLELITSSIEMQRRKAERQASNMPIQGTQADMMKAILVSIDAKLQVAAMRSRLVLSVHDEVVLVVPDAELARAKRLVADEMRNSLQLPMNVKPRVKIGLGANWHEASSSAKIFQGE
ncbi:DNA polymerase I, thermostable [Porphyridium purpureum]|uniref:DNA-directed DNA polymerase n=1 Tax=Porphyridium purpureum TaxID=35688 RepID=A0A5J4Z770_PORPP|nr:DNA polymerase I, thermostable [Porphyridium purpureum]|eukprot:POR2213..scf295_1